MGYDAAAQPQLQLYQQSPPSHQEVEQQQQELIQYPIGNGIREQNYAQHVYGLSPDVLFQSQKDIEYAKPAEDYGLPPKQYLKKQEYSQRDYSQDVTPPKPTQMPPTPSYQPEIRYSNQMKSVEYQSQPSQVDSSPSNSYQNTKKSPESALSYGYENQLVQASTSTSKSQNYYLSHQNEFKYNPKAEENEKPVLSENYENYPQPTAPSETQTYYLNHLKEIKSVHQAESAQKPAITYGPPDTVGKEPEIEYGVPDAPFRRPVAESNQDVYAPRRPSSSGRSGKSFAVSFPYPPSFVSFTTTEKLPSEKSTSSVIESSSNNEVNPWRPIHVSRPSLGSKYRSLGQTFESSKSHQSPLPDFFHTRRSKSLLDSYIPSWLVRRMQEEHSRRGEEGLAQQQSYTITSPQAEDSYNTISYSSNENIYGSHFKRSISKRKGHQQKKVPTSDEEMTAVE
ncbi:basic-leucine zipper transcription factor A [Episyrphus balteatus]|uniref:basic-leucine zipper transcription factor A n=1 Tax=Episyrphus balteatus TaxID=286459 RepID=UPI002485ACAB|nr:basic-leucine zipper transcription factor A [Episyrphus balteatus]